MDNDTISRQAAIDALRYAQHRFTVADEAGGMGTVKWSENVIYSAAAERVLTELPSAQPEQKTARWIPLLDERFASWSDYFKCSECGFRIKLRAVTDFGGKSVNYCPHCGAKMEAKTVTITQDGYKEEAADKWNRRG